MCKSTSMLSFSFFSCTKILCMDYEKTMLPLTLAREPYSSYVYHGTSSCILPMYMYTDNYFVVCRKDANYKRTVIACFIQAVYLLELDRQESKTQENALAPNWW